MPHPTAIKRKAKLLDYTTDEFVQKLNNRGYVLNLSILPKLHSMIVNEMQKGIDCHQRIFWEKQNIDLEDSVHGYMPIHRLCSILCPLHIYNINYTHLAVVFHTFDAQKWINFYRYCYLEWAKHNMHSNTLWKMTPRELSNTVDGKLKEYIEAFLNSIFLECNEDMCVQGLFLVNRLFKYLIPA